VRLKRLAVFCLNHPVLHWQTRSEFVDITQFKASQYLFARPNIRFLDPARPNPMTLGDAYWEHQQLQKQINEQTKKAGHSKNLFW
jgi:hypothetical protein